MLCIVLLCIIHVILKMTQRVNKNHPIVPVQVKDGDLVLFHTQKPWNNVNGFLARTFQGFQNSLFDHIGIVVFKRDCPYIFEIYRGKAYFREAQTRIAMFRGLCAIKHRKGTLDLDQRQKLQHAATTLCTRLHSDEKCSFLYMLMRCVRHTWCDEIDSNERIILCIEGVIACFNMADIPFGYSRNVWDNSECMNTFYKKKLTFTTEIRQSSPIIPSFTTAQVYTSRRLLPSTYTKLSVIKAKSNKCHRATPAARKLTISPKSSSFSPAMSCLDRRLGAGIGHDAAAPVSLS